MEKQKTNGRDTKVTMNDKFTAALRADIAGKATPADKKLIAEYVSAQTGPAEVTEDSPEVPRVKRKYTRREPAGEIIEAKGGGKASKVPLQAEKGKLQGGKSLTFDVAPINTETIKVSVKGDSSLITHAWDSKGRQWLEDRDQQERKPNKKNTVHEKRFPREDWHGARYLDSEGRDCIPAHMFKFAMVAAASFLPEASKLLIKGSVFVYNTENEELAPLEYDGEKYVPTGPDFRLTAQSQELKDGKPVMTTVPVESPLQQFYKKHRNQPSPPMDTRIANIGGWEKAIPSMRYRPIYHNWSCDLHIQFDSTVMSPVMVVNLLNRAGFNVGVAELRPLGKKSSGPHGRFHVVDGRKKK